MAKREIRSPLPGTFYRKASPETPEFKQDGDAIVASDVIGLVEVMKTFHDVPAMIAGTNIKFLVDDADAVMAGQVLAEVDE